MKLNFHPTRAAVLVGAALLSATFAFPAMAAGGASGPKVAYMAQGNIGEVMVNPYRIAPLTAVIRSGGYVVKNASVRIVPKQNGQEIRYSVSDENVRTAGGIPVFGLYPDWLNTVEVEYDRVFNGKTEHFSDRYQLYAAPVFLRSNGTPGQTHTTFNVKVLKMDPAFKDRLYFINNLIPTPPDASRVVWNNPMGGALEWAFGPENAIVDSTGTVRWYLNPDVEMYDPDQPYKAGIMMGFEQTADGGLLFGYGQRYAKYDMTGREIFNRRLPMGYADYSHGLDAAQNGHIFLRVSAADHRRLDGKRVHTVRDVIAEVDQDGRVVDEFRLFEILDPYRDNVIKALDQGAVCLNIDASQAGKTLSADELAAMDKNDRFGDIAGVGAGRNWAHVNSVDYDPADDSIIISSRHQSAVIKIGRDKAVKWILSAPNGWNDQLRGKVLTPVDAGGKPITCRIGRCEGEFDWTWTQHTGWKVDELSEPGVTVLTVFDNGDGRAFQQPENAAEKYSRAVMYRIDEKKGTVEQIWEYGKKRGHELYSAITSSVEYQADHDSLVVYWASRKLAEGGEPILTEFKRGGQEPVFEMALKGTMGYRAVVIDVKKAFNP